jgi:hypothetical protein
MRMILTIAMAGSALLMGSALADDAYPRSAELVAAQTELDALRRLGLPNQLSAADQQRWEAARKVREAELEKRNNEWKQKDSTSMLKTQAETCSVVRQGLNQGKKSTDYFDTLRYAGFSVEEALDVVLQITRRTPQIGKSVRVAFCILGVPTETVRRESRNSRTTMLVYPKMFVHIEDGIVTSWSDR